MTAEQFAQLQARRAPKKAAAPSAAAIREADIQSQIETLLRAFGRSCWFTRSRMDKATTQRPGVPDFIGVYCGVPFALEVKRQGGKETREQAGELLWFKLAGGQSAVVRSIAEAEAFFHAMTK